jgi:sugar transferase (PEP-CTERM/EpsH1 system associated)
VANILYLVHRLPYPPNKGDKVRSYHLLKHLASQHRVYLGTFVDDPDDLQYLGEVRAHCADLCAIQLQPVLARVKSLLGLLTGQSLTEQYYRHRALQRWVDALVEGGGIDAAVAFSSSMAQYALPHPQLPLLADLVDVDSAKWTQYGDARSGPMAWLYHREGRSLLDFERTVVRRARQSYLVTDREVELFDRLSPDCRGRVSVSGNGVNADYFAPDASLPSPFAPGEAALVFTGAMDYWPNVDAVTWFANEMLPALRRLHPGLRFYIVGRSPTPAVTGLASDAVTVTGTVPDVRPYLQHAAVVVAPLRLARGIQNKVLEAMAMARPVVASTSCLEPIDAVVGTDILGAAVPADFVTEIARLLADPELAGSIGRAARHRVLDRYSWEANLRVMDTHLYSIPHPMAADPLSGVAA